MLGRLFEYTDQEIADVFRDNGQLNLAELAKQTCLFMHEGINGEIARVGSITRARAVGRDIALECVFDPEVPPIQNQQIIANRAYLDMPE